MQVNKPTAVAAKSVYSSSVPNIQPGKVVPNSQNSQPVKIEPQKVIEAIALLEMYEQSTLNICLSILMQKTSDNDSEIVLLDKYPKLLTAVITVLDHVNPLADMFMKSLFKDMNHILPSLSGRGSVLQAIDMITMSGNKESYPAYPIPCLTNELYKVILFRCILF